MLVAATTSEAQHAARLLQAAGFLHHAEVGFGIGTAEALECFELIELVEMGALARRRAAGGRRPGAHPRSPTAGRRAAGALPRCCAGADLRRSTRRGRPPWSAVPARGPLGAALLARRGFTDLRPVLAGGMSAWGTREAVEAAEAEAAATKAEVRAKG